MDHTEALPDDGRRDGGDDTNGDGGHDIEKVPPQDDGSKSTSSEIPPPKDSVPIINFRMSGQRLVEVLCVHTNSPFIKGIESNGIRISKFCKARELWLSNNPGRDPFDFMVTIVPLA
jgi:hypothetical protein